MKKTRLSSLVVLAVAAALSGCASKEDYAFEVGPLACPNCAKEVEHELMEVKGVRQAKVDFDSATAKVWVNTAAPASQKDLSAAVAKWKAEHFGVKEDPNCLDPERRQELKQQAK